MTATISAFDLTDHVASTTSATATIFTDLAPIDANDKLLSFQLGNTGFIIKIDAVS